MIQLGHFLKKCVNMFACLGFLSISNYQRSGGTGSHFLRHSLSTERGSQVFIPFLKTYIVFSETIENRTLIHMNFFHEHDMTWQINSLNEWHSSWNTRYSLKFSLQTQFLAREGWTTQQRWHACYCHQHDQRSVLWFMSTKWHNLSEIQRDMCTCMGKTVWTIATFPGGTIPSSMCTTWRRCYSPQSFPYMSLWISLRLCALAHKNCTMLCCSSHWQLKCASSLLHSSRLSC